MTIVKLSDERVREILSKPNHTELQEIVALAQNVLDLRTTVGMLEQACADRDKQIEDFMKGEKKPDA